MARDEPKQIIIVRKDLNMRKGKIAAILLGVMFGYINPTHANEFVNGSTISTSFISESSNGELQGCTITYQTMGIDIAGGKEKPMIIVGNIGIGRITQKGDLVIHTKIGIIDPPNYNKTIPPYTGYLTTSNHSTVNVLHRTFVGDTNARLYVYPFLSDEYMQDFYGDILKDKSLNVVVSRKKGSLDMSFPIDLTVDDIQFDTNGVPHQIKSNTNMVKFTDCAKQLFNIVQQELVQLKEQEPK